MATTKLWEDVINCTASGLIRESIALASVLKLSDDELGEVAAACNIAWSVKEEDTLQALREHFELDMVVMTRGPLGAILVTREASVDQPGIPTKVVSTVGAGDSFTAALVLGVLRGDEATSMLRKACETASKVCSHPGAVPTPAN